MVVGSFQFMAMGIRGHYITCKTWISVSVSKDGEKIHLICILLAPMFNRPFRWHELDEDRERNEHGYKKYLGAKNTQREL